MLAGRLAQDTKNLTGALTPPSARRKRPIVSCGEPYTAGSKWEEQARRCGVRMQSSRHEKTTWTGSGRAPQGSRPIGARQSTASWRAIGLGGCTCNITGLVSPWLFQCGYLGFCWRVARCCWLLTPSAFSALASPLLLRRPSSKMFSGTCSSSQCRCLQARHVCLPKPIPPSGSSITPSLDSRPT